MNLQDLEKPVGCIRALALARRTGGITVTDLIQNEGMPQKTAYSSLKKLMDLNLLECKEIKEAGRSMRRYSPTKKAEKLAMYLDTACTTIEKLEERNNALNLGRFPFGSLSILTRIYEDGFTTISNLREEGMCGSTAYSALQFLREAGLIYQEVESDFPRTVKKYKLTDDGAYLGKVLDLANAAMMLL